MSHIVVAGERFEFSGASLVVYHCLGEDADWNLELVREGESLWLAGTMRPGPRSADDLVGAEVEVDLRSLDEVVSALLGRPITLYPGGQAVCALRFMTAGSPEALVFAATCSCDWDPYLQSFPVAGAVALELAIEARVEALHPGHLPA